MYCILILKMDQNIINTSILICVHSVLILRIFIEDIWKAISEYLTCTYQSALLDK